MVILNGEVILKKEILDKMLSPKVEKELLPPWFMELGMGFYSMKLDNGEPVWGHTGANPGSSTFMFFNPEIKLGAIVLANRFVDIRDLITWIFAETFNEFNEIDLEYVSENWKQYSDQYLKNSCNKRVISIQVFSKNLPRNSSVYVNGNHRYLGSWISKGISLEKAENGNWSKNLTFYDSTQIEYKITCGSWDKQAVDSMGNDLPPFSLLVLNDTTNTIDIDYWKDTFHK